MKFKVNMECEYSVSTKFAKDIFGTRDPKKIAKMEEEVFNKNFSEFSVVSRKNLKVTVTPIP